MRLVAEKEPLRRNLKWAQRALLVCGVLLLAYCGFVLVDARIFQERESRDLDRLLRDRRTTSEGVVPTSAKTALAAATDGLVGRIEIPRLLLSVVVVEGIGRSALRRAAGHIPLSGTPPDAHRRLKLNLRCASGGVVEGLRRGLGETWVEASAGFGTLAVAWGPPEVCY